MKVDLYNAKGEVVGDIELDDSIFAIEPNEYAVHQYVTAYLANQRQGTQSAKTRAEVSGGGRKPWRQKGTGRARVGSSRNPIWRHGGVAFAPKPRDYSQNINKKMKRLALKSVFSSKVTEKELFIVDELSFQEPNTKSMIAVLNSFNVPGALIVTAADDKNIYKSTRNIPASRAVDVGILNVYELLKYHNVILTKDSLAKITEIYA